MSQAEVLRVVLCAVGVVAFARLAMVLHRRRSARTASPWLIGTVWVTLSVLFVAGSFTEPEPKFAFLECELPGRDSVFGTATWQSWPPGAVCRDLEGRVFSRPGFRDGAVIVIAALGSFAFLVGGAVALRDAARRRRVRKVEHAA